MPVVVARDNDGSIAAFENRCAHRGALICLDNAGKGAKDFQCVYHAWRYDLRGNLQSVAFQRGVKGKGGMPADFRVEDHGPRQLRVTTLHGLVFGTFSDETPAIENFIGPEVLARFDRILGSRKIEIIGRFVEVLPNNWKMYAENARDSYHASLLHLFFATFKLNRLSQGGGLVVSPNGGCSVSETFAPTDTDDKAYAGMRSVDEDYKLKDMRLMDVVDEHPDRIRHQIVTVFPNFVLQKTQNAMAIRFFTPNAVDRTHLEWIYFGYADDTPEMRKRRLRHLNLGGPAGFVSMEDDNHKRGHSAGVVYADSRAMLQDRVAALRNANIYERQSYRHIVGLPVIGANGADNIAAETPFLVARIMRDGRTDLFVTGVYIDRIRDEAGSLRFAERLVVCDSSHFDTLLAIPL